VSSPALHPDRDRLRELFPRVRRFTETLCEPLELEDYVVQSMPDASPTKWHLAHTSWFFETFVLARAGVGYAPIDPRYAYLFNSYYHAAGERHPQAERGALSRPTVAEVLAYRRHVDRAMHRVLDSAPSAVFDELAFVVELGLNHEEQHQELIVTDVKHVLATNPLAPAYVAAPASTRSTPARLHWVALDGGSADVGARAAGFAFDNERPRHPVLLAPFELANRPASCAEYLEFIGDGGYARSELWLSDGWDACQRHGWSAPLYWQQVDGEWTHATLHGPRAIDPAEPVCHVSYYEADAFARWAGARLPLEAEWEHAAEGCEAAGNFVESGRFHPAPAADSARLVQMFGDVWEWTASPYQPYPGFAPFPGVLGEYNGKFMINRVVLRGGSCATPARHIRSSYRNFFLPDARWQFSGVRLTR
jgi:ergothioneine biosynthesis protein EgtB